jgi:MFS family permease
MTSTILHVRSRETLTGDGRMAACTGAVALVSLLACEAMAVAASMPAVALALDGISFYALVFGGMLATSILGMVLAGRWCDQGKLLRTTAMGLATFAAGLLIAGCADRMAWLVAGRVAQGLGGGMLEVSLFVGMGQLVPPPLHPRLFALFSAAWVMPGLIGPVVAAGLVEYMGWRSVFLLAAAATPFAAALLLPAFSRLPTPTPIDTSVLNQAPALRWAFLAAAGALLMQGVSVAGTGWHAVATGSFGMAASLVAAWRLLPPGTLCGRRGLPAVVALRGLLAAAFGTAEVFIPLFLTSAMGWSIGQAGVALSVGAVLWSCGSATQSRVTSENKRRWLLRVGFLAVALGIAAVTTCLVAAMPPWTFLVGWAVAGFGIGIGSPTLSVLTLRLSLPEDRGRHSAALQLSTSLCTSAALAMAGGMMALAKVSRANGFMCVMMMASALAMTGVALAGRAVPTIGRKSASM